MVVVRVMVVEVVVVKRAVKIVRVMMMDMVKFIREIIVNV